jgi:hypothetical protein
MPDLNFIEISSSEGHNREFVSPHDVASFEYFPRTSRAETCIDKPDYVDQGTREIPAECTIKIRLKNGRSIVRRGVEAEALRAKLTDGS